jgi:hypothetical protein
MAHAASEKVERRNAESLGEDSRNELAKLLSSLRSELAILSRTHRQEAHNISGFARAASHEATRAEPDLQRLKATVENLKSSAEEFEATHPGLVQIVAAITSTLAGMGI